MVKLFESFRNNVIELELPKTIKWYTCGPTIYDDSHIGHARTFITNDIIRKYLESKNHNVLYGMNITDIDDKIMNKVKRMHWSSLLSKLNINLEIWSDEKCESLLSEKFTEEEMTPPMDLFYDFINNEEKKFWCDMKSINVKMPYAKIRVTQVQDEIIEFIQTLIDKDIAYVSGKGIDKSVYFDTQKFRELQIMNHSQDTCDYLLHKENSNDMNLKNDFSSEKKHPYDFSLWKAKKKYEISFKSPWGNGHVSWHTECSVMINKLFKSKIDIHSGGIDLKFPHHHNECIQTIAYTNNYEWNKYFLHSGHLHINNEKMSKSLGNMVTIKSFLNLYNYRVLRLIFINSKWNEILNFSEDIINHAFDFDNKLLNFFENINHHINLGKMKDSIDNDDCIFENSINIHCAKLDEHWDNFDTQKILLEIRKIMDDTNKYLQNNYNLINILRVRDILNNQFNILGIDYSFNKVQNIDKHTKNEHQYIDAIIEIRNKLKNTIFDITNEHKEVKKKLYNICDWIRDVKMKSIGIKIEDLKDSTKWNYLTESSSNL